MTFRFFKVACKQEYNMPVRRLPSWVRKSGKSSSHKNLRDARGYCLKGYAKSRKTGRCRKTCKSTHKRSRKTGRCINRKSARLRRMRERTKSRRVRCGPGTRRVGRQCVTPGGIVVRRRSSVRRSSARRHHASSRRRRRSSQHRRRFVV
jgi:hypothetical protein